MASTNTGLNAALRRVGASAGGVKAVTESAAGPPGVLARILDRNGPLPAMALTDGAELSAGRIYVAAPDRHLVVSKNRADLAGEAEHAVTVLGTLLSTTTSCAGEHGDQ